MRKKKGKCVEDMADLIATKFVVNKRVACGIVYCLSRNDCEKVAADLQARHCSLSFNVSLQNPRSCHSLLESLCLQSTCY